MRLRFWKLSANAVPENKKPDALDDSKHVNLALKESSLFLPNGSSSSSPTKEKEVDDDLVEDESWSLKKFWNDSVSVEIPLVENRDHLCMKLNPLYAFRLNSVSANEQTFLTWLSLADGISLLGIVIAQVSRIQRVVHADQENTLCYLLLGTPQACLCQLIAVFILLVGAFRFLRQQNAIAQGYARIGGWELHSVWILILLVCIPNADWLASSSLLVTDFGCLLSPCCRR